MWRTIKLLYFLDFRHLKNLINVEHSGMCTESGGQECKVKILWDGHKILKKSQVNVSYSLTSKEVGIFFFQIFVAFSEELFFNCTIRFSFKFKIYGEKQQKSPILLPLHHPFILLKILFKLKTWKGETPYVTDGQTGR